MCIQMFGWKYTVAIITSVPIRAFTLQLTSESKGQQAGMCCKAAYEAVHQVTADLTHSVLLCARLYSDTLQFSGMHVAWIFSWASQIVCRHVRQALFTDIQHPFLLAWLSRCEVGRGCVMYIIGNQISWVPSSCFLSKTTCPLNWKPECNCHISCQRVLTPLHAW